MNLRRLRAVARKEALHVRRDPRSLALALGLPMLMLVMFGYFISLFALSAINETWVAVLSFVPFFTPYVMLARVAIGHVEWWEFSLAVVIMLATITVALFAAARIYSAGVLLYGQHVGLRQVLKAARVSR